MKNKKVELELAVKLDLKMGKVEFDELTEEQTIAVSNALSRAVEMALNESLESLINDVKANPVSITVTTRKSNVNTDQEIPKTKKVKTEEHNNKNEGLSFGDYLKGNKVLDVNEIMKNEEIVNEVRTLTKSLINDTGINKLFVIVDSDKGRQKFTSSQVIGDLTDDTIKEVVGLVVKTNGDFENLDVQKFIKILFEEGIKLITSEDIEYTVVITDVDADIEDIDSGDKLQCDCDKCRIRRILGHE